MKLMRLPLLLFAALAIFRPFELSGQSSRWEVTTQLQAGMYAPTRDLGTRGVVQARMRQAPIIAGLLQLGRSNSPLSVYLASTQALQGGFRA